MKRLQNNTEGTIYIFAVLAALLLLLGCETTPKHTAPKCTTTKEEILTNQEHAEAGDREAQVRVAKWHDFGVCLTKDTSKALDWYHRAANQGHRGAQRKIAFMYFYGTGVAQDIDKAEKWYRKAAEQGDILAARTLGDLYYTGQHKPRDLNQAEKWYRLAIKNGSSAKSDRLDKIMKEKDPVAWAHKERERIAKQRQKEQERIAAQKKKYREFQEKRKRDAQAKALALAKERERLRKKRLKQHRSIALRYAQKAKARFHSIEVTVEEGKSSKRKRIKAPSPVVKGIKSVAKAIVVIPLSTVGYGLMGVLEGAQAGAPGAAVGGIFGSAVGFVEGVKTVTKTTPAEQKARIKAASSTLKQTLSQKDFVRDLKAQLLAIATQQQAGDLITDISGTARYRLNVEIVRFGLIVKDKGEGRIRAAVRVNLVDQQNNNVLPESQICYVSAKPRSITVWGGDTQRLDEDLKDAYTNLSNQILTEIFDLAEYPDIPKSWADTHKVCESKPVPKGTTLALVSSS